MKKKRCTKCKKWKSLSFFTINRNHKDNLQHWCKQCKKKYDKQYKKKNPLTNKKATLKFWYGLTIEDYNKMFEEQQGYCAVCGIHQSKLSKSLCVDHNHLTGKIRKLICSRCNLGLGIFEIDKVNTKLLLRAIKYVKDTI